MGVSPQTIAQWENNLRNPKIETLQRIANAIGVPYTSLLPEGDEYHYWLEAVVKRNLQPAETFQAIADKTGIPVDFIWAAHLKPEMLEPDYLDKIREVTNTMSIEFDSNEYQRLHEILREVRNCLYYKLNEEGREKGVELFKLVTEIPRYQKKPPQATAQDGGEDNGPPPSEGEP